MFLARDMSIERRNVTFGVRGRDSVALVCYVSKMRSCNMTRNRVQLRREENAYWGEMFFAPNTPVERRNVTFGVRGRDSGTLVCYVLKTASCNTTRNRAESDHGGTDDGGRTTHHGRGSGGASVRD